MQPREHGLTKTGPRHHIHHIVGKYRGSGVRDTTHANSTVKRVHKPWPLQEYSPRVTHHLLPTRQRLDSNACICNEALFITIFGAGCRGPGTSLHMPHITKSPTPWACPYWYARACAFYSKFLLALGEIRRSGVRACHVSYMCLL